MEAEDEGRGSKCSPAKRTLVANKRTLVANNKRTLGANKRTLVANKRTIRGHLLPIMDKFLLPQLKSFNMNKVL